MFNEFRDFWRADFHPASYLSILIFMTGSIIANYAFDFKNTVLFQWPYGWSRLLVFSGFYAFAYVTSIALRAVFDKEFRGWRAPRFWRFAAAALFMVGLNGSLLPLFWLVEVIPISDELWQYVLRLLLNFSSIMVFALGLIILRLTLDRGAEGWYGFRRADHFQNYWLLLMASMPFLAAAALLPDFQQVYPTYRSFGAETALGVSPVLTIGAYEFSYALNFVLVEWFFRGFLVIGLIRILGREAVLPMVVLYVFWHFGKPPAETIAAVFGGFALGVIAYQSRSILGGVLLHIGIALLMELFAALAKTWTGLHTSG